MIQPTITWWPMKIALSFLVTCLLFLFQIAALAQSSYNKVLFNSNYGGAEASTVHKTNDGNFIIAGSNGNSTASIIKIDPDGNILWDKEYGSSGQNGAFFEIEEIADGYVAVGYLIPYLESAEKFLCIKINLAGDVVWAKKYDFGTIDEFCFDIESTNDGGFILTGNSGYDDNAALVAKISALGDIIWVQQYTAGDDYKIDLNETKATPDGGFIMTGKISLYDHPYTPSALILETDSVGVPVWAKKITAPLFTGSNGCGVIIKPNEFVFTINTTNQWYGLVILRTDVNGTPILANWYYANFFENWIFIHPSPFPSLVALNDGGYIFLSKSYYEGSLIRLDSLLNPTFHRNLMFTSVNVVPTDDGGFLSVGNGPVYGASMGDIPYPHIGLYKSDSLGETPNCNYEISFVHDTFTLTMNAVSILHGGSASATDIVQTATPAGLSVSSECVTLYGAIEEKKQVELIISPNPNRGTFQLLINGNSNAQINRIEVFDFTGKMFFESSNSFSSGQRVELGNVPPGIYLIRAFDGSVALLKRIVVE
jgi:hypothetical protein